jgi:hypothetical protein
VKKPKHDKSTIAVSTQNMLPLQSIGSNADGPLNQSGAVPHELLPNGSGMRPQFRKVTIIVNRKNEGERCYADRGSALEAIGNDTESSLFEKDTWWFRFGEGPWAGPFPEFEDARFAVAALYNVSPDCGGELLNFRCVPVLRHSDYERGIDRVLHTLMLRMRVAGHDRSCCTDLQQRTPRQ